MTRAPRGCALPSTYLYLFMRLVKPQKVPVPAVTTPQLPSLPEGSGLNLPSECS